MIGTARKCPECGDAFTLRVDSTLPMMLAGTYLFLLNFSKHVRACRQKAGVLREGLNEAGLFYMGLQK